MVDKTVVQNRINYIEANIKDMTELAKLSEAEFLGRFYYISSAKYLLQTSIEAMLDIAHHIIARQRYRTPDSYAEAFAILAEQGILPAGSESKYRQIAKFRNRVVHLYHDVDNREVFRILKDCIGDFRLFIKSVAEHI